MALETTLPAEVKLTRFEREADAREPFSTWVKREKRAIAPDVFIEIADADGRSLLAFVELDLGTMSHRRLKRKAGGYAEYARAEAWRGHHRFCPALLFLTTTEKRPVPSSRRCAGSWEEMPSSLPAPATSLAG